MRELLLLLCKYPYKEKNHELLSKLISEVKDWPKLVKLINAHGIIALAAYNIKEAGLEKEVPPESMEIIKKGYTQRILRNSWLTGRWKEINNTLNDAGIKHVLLKGMALEYTLYDGRGLREMSDNDILIKREDAYRAWLMLQEKGFKPGLIKSPLYKKILTDIDNHLPALYKDGYSVEIHTHLFGSADRHKSLNNNLFDYTEEIKIEGEKSFMLKKDIHLKYLVSHFERHLNEGICQLKSYADIILLNNSIRLDFPENFIIEPFQSKSLEMHKWVYRSKVSSVSSRNRLRYILGDLFPSVEWMKKRYTCSGIIAIFHYPQRLGKLLWLI
jgi:hypothetical protein